MNASDDAANASTRRGGAPQVSAIIPAYNAEGTINRAVRSLTRTRYEGLEIIIVDDGSHDHTMSQSHNLKRTVKDATVIVVQHPHRENRGVSASRNLGIKSSTGEWICFLDSDDTVEPHRFEKATQILSESSDVDGVYETASVIVEDASQTKDWEDQSIFGLQVPLQGNELLKSLIHGSPWHTSAILFRRTLLDKTGLFHEGLSIAEDCHLWMRMVAAGKVVPGDLGRPVSNYHRHEGSLYTSTVERKLDYLRALADFLEWIEHYALSTATKILVRQEIAKWLDNALIQCRENAKRRLAWKIGAFAAGKMPGLAIRRRNIAHLLYAMMRK